MNLSGLEEISNLLEAILNKQVNKYKKQTWKFALC